MKFTRPKTNINFVELFAGAGGFGDGFLNEGFKPVAMVDTDKHCCETLKTRLAYHHKEGLGFYNAYLKGEISKDFFYSKIPERIFNKVVQKEINQGNFENIKNTIKLNLGNKELDLILGGPPCQAYSIIGRSNSIKKEHDHRLYLYQFYASFLKEFSPKIFLFENVAGLLSLNNGNLFRAIKKEFKKAGYDITWRVLDSSEYGVLQKRKRIIIIGVRKNLNVMFCFDNIPKINHQYLVKHVLQDLDVLNSGQSSNKYMTETNDYLKKFNIRNEGDNNLTCHAARPHNQIDLEIYKIAVSLWDKGKDRLKYNNLPAAIRTHKNLKSFLDRFKVVAGNLSYSHTLVAHIAKDGHHYIHPDIRQNRSLTVREAARLQSFPDNYFFEGPRTSQFAQIGNAVPPILSKTLAKEIKKIL